MSTQNLAQECLAPAAGAGNKKKQGARKGRQPCKHQRFPHYRPNRLYHPVCTPESDLLSAFLLAQSPGVSYS